MAEAMMEAGVAVVEGVGASSSRRRTRQGEGGARSAAMEMARWPVRAGCYGGLCHVHGRSEQVDAGLGRKAASSGPSSMVMDNGANVDWEWISRSISRKLACLVSTDLLGKASQAFSQGTTCSQARSRRSSPDNCPRPALTSTVHGPTLPPTGRSKERPFRDARAPVFPSVGERQTSKRKFGCPSLLDLFPFLFNAPS